jgi:hypothetical protein
MMRSAVVDQSSSTGSGSAATMPLDDCLAFAMTCTRPTREKSRKPAKQGPCHWVQRLRHSNAWEFTLGFSQLELDARLLIRYAQALRRAFAYLLGVVFVRSSCRGAASRRTQIAVEGRDSAAAAKSSLLLPVKPKSLIAAGRPPRPANWRPKANGLGAHRRDASACRTIDASRTSREVRTVPEGTSLLLHRPVRAREPG